MEEECRCTSIERIVGLYCTKCFHDLLYELSPELQILENELKVIQLQKYRAEVVGMKYWEIEKEGFNTLLFRYPHL